jgi:hypothetical protein
MHELVTEFQKQEEWCSYLEGLGIRVYHLILVPPCDRAQLADRLEEAAR